MAAKKNEAAKKAAELKTASAAEELKDDTQKGETEVEKNTAAKPSVNDTDGFCVYIGPTIQGVIQTGTVYSGTRESVKELLASAIKRYPLIARLIVTDDTFVEDRIKVKTSGNLLNVFYKKLASGQKTI